MPFRRLALLLPIVMFSMPAIAQPFAYPQYQAGADPLMHPKEIAGNREILLVYDEEGNNGFGVRQKYFDVNTYTNGSPNNVMQLQANAPVHEGPDYDGSRQMAVAAGDLDGDGRTDHVVATVATDQSVHLQAFRSMPYVSPMQMVPGGSINDAGPIYQGGSEEDNGSNGIMKLRCGDLDGDGNDEVALLFRRSDNGLLRIHLFDADEDLQFTSMGSIQDEALIPTVYGGEPFESFDLAVEDFDHDGKAEIMIAGAGEHEGHEAPFLKLYAVQVAGGNATLFPKDKVFAPSVIPSDVPMPLAITTGDFNNDLIMEVALAFGYQNTQQPGDPDTFIRMFRVGDDQATDPDDPDWLERIVDTGNEYSATLNTDGLSTLCLDAGDVMNTGRDVLVLATGTDVRAFSITDDFDFQDLQGITLPNSNPDMRYGQYMAVCDMNNDGIAEVVNVRDYKDLDDFPNMEYIAITVHQWGNGAFQQVVGEDQVLGQELQGHNRRFAMVAGDFDGDGVRFGAHDEYEVADVVQPIVILNSPPLHSDDVGPNGWVDVNQVFGPPTDCSAWQAHYSEASNNSFTVETQTSNAWAVSATVGVGYEGLVGSIGASLTSTYGGGYSNTDMGSTTYSEVSTHDICYDDAIYASVTSYSVREYPIYANDTLVCYVMGIHPDSTYFTWLESKDISARGYAPSHEVGNILSYRRIGSNTVPATDIFADHQFTMGQNSSGTWTVTSGTLDGSQTETSRHVGISASLNASVFGFSLGLTGSYDMSTISTHMITVGQDISVSTGYGPLGNNAATMGYNTRPYLIWGNSGALALDYEVLPTGSFYDLYDTPDPALNLPWRLDTERGLTLPDPIERLRSKSFFLSDGNPMPGDTIRVMLRIYNYSNSPTDGPVQVSFYIGHPDMGGTLQQDLDGNTVFATAMPIPAQGVDTLSFEWVTPGDSTVVGRLYAKLDPEGLMDEVHENNNIGFVSLGAFYPNQTEVGVTEVNRPQAGALHCFPNPASTHCTVALILDHPDVLSTELLDATGKCVRTLAGRSFGSGMARIPVDLQGLPAGLYNLLVRGGHSVFTGRVVVQ
jgi:hypothetical protein